jgi:hypothetical protein
MPNLKMAWNPPAFVRLPSQNGAVPPLLKIIVALVEGVAVVRIPTRCNDARRLDVAYVFGCDVPPMIGDSPKLLSVVPPLPKALTNRTFVIPMCGWKLVITPAASLVSNMFLPALERSYKRTPLAVLEAVLDEYDSSTNEFALIVTAVMDTAVTDVKMGVPETLIIGALAVPPVVMFSPG